MSHETMTKLFLLFAVFVCLYIAQATVYGQEEDQRAKAQVPAGKLTIFNSSDSIQSHFDLRNGTGPWKTFSLDPLKQQMFTTATSFRIATKDGKTKYYRLEDQTRYIIFWDDSEKCWALAKAAQQN